MEQISGGELWWLVMLFLVWLSLISVVSEITLKDFSCAKVEVECLLCIDLSSNFESQNPF